MPYTYLVQCADGSYYAGWTTDLEARMQAHNEGRGARYTRSRRPVQLVYWEFQPTRSTAQRREAALRRLSRNQKAALVDAFEVSQRSFVESTH
jgi:putative endonuclease